MEDNINIEFINNELIKRLAKAKVVRRKTELEELEEEIRKVFKVAIKDADERSKNKFKGKDGREYDSFEELSAANEFYEQTNNPTIQRHR